MRFAIIVSSSLHIVWIAGRDRGIPYSPSGSAESLQLAPAFSNVAPTRPKTRNATPLRPPSTLPTIGEVVGSGRPRFRGVKVAASILDDRIALVASVSDASDDLPRGQAQAICRYTGLLASDREVAATRGLDTRREREPVQQRTGDDQVEARPLGVLLESRGGIEDVTDEDDWLSEVAKLAGGHGAAVESAAKTGTSPKSP